MREGPTPNVDPALLWRAAPVRTPPVHRQVTASPTWLKLGAATRLVNESGPEALQRVQTLLSDLALLSVPINPGPTEAMCYILQGQLTPEELRRWMVQANADKDVTDDGIHAKEDALAARLATPNRLSVAKTDFGAERDS